MNDTYAYIYIMRIIYITYIIYIICIICIIYLIYIRCIIPMHRMDVQVHIHVKKR